VVVSGVERKAGEEVSHNVSRCDRCSETFASDWVTYEFTARPGGHTSPSLTPFITSPIPSAAQLVCYNCLTDNEILRRMRTVIIWLLTATIDQLSKSGGWEQLLPALETVKAMYTVLNLGPKPEYRADVIKVLRGLAQEDS
jgi:hypothetical protein